MSTTGKRNGSSSIPRSVRDRAEQGSAHESPEILLYSSSDEERQTHPKQKGKPSRADANRADDGGDDPDADLTTLPAWPADMEFGAPQLIFENICFTCNLATFTNLSSGWLCVS